jgi:hypothetical protein
MAVSKEVGRQLGAAAKLLPHAPAACSVSFKTGRRLSDAAASMHEEDADAAFGARTDSRRVCGARRMVAAGSRKQSYNRTDPDKEH